MAREREQPPAGSGALRQSSSTSLNARSESRAEDPKFGEASPLRNPLRKEDKYSHLFNVPKPGQKRVEHFREPALAPKSPSTSDDNSSFLPDASSTPWHAPKPAPAPALAPGTTWSSIKFPDLMEIPRPANFPAAPRQNPVPIPRPTNQTQFDTFKTVPQYPVTFHDDDDQDGGFNPDAALREDRFGAPDPYMYKDPAKANDELKALMEGAFEEDEDDKPRRLLRRRKPQRKSNGEIASLAGKLKALEVEEKNEGGPNEEEDDEDDGSVDGLKVKLLPHQVEGVAWMLDKEIHQKKKNGIIPKGGILADDMGLGKTIQSLALILQNPRPTEEELAKDKKRKITPEVGKGTLVVAPLALIKQWESEINTKVTSDYALKVLVHHGASRTKRASDLKKYDVVITTYQIMASEHANSDDNPKGIQTGCFGVQWYRIILDEAHTIKNRNAKMTKACYALQSHYRWCLTGTPMQNNLDELQSLIRFLQIKPYSELSEWKASITQPMKNGRGGLAMRRLQVFLKAFMKRRTKDVLKKEGALNPGGKAKEGEEKNGFRIVARNVETRTCKLNGDERRFYNKLADRAQSRLEEMMGGEKQDYIGALVLLLRLRQACNHPELMTYSLKKDKDALTTGSKSGPQSQNKTTDDDLNDLTNMLGGLSVETKQCDVCQIVLSKAEASSGAERCADCEADLQAQRKRHKKKKKRHSSKRIVKTDRSHEVVDDDEEEDDDVVKKPSRSNRQRRVITDSDDEEEGDWIVPEHERETKGLGRAGGTSDEDAEGGGDTLGSADSETEGDDEEEEEEERDDSSEVSGMQDKPIGVDSTDDRSSDDEGSARDNSTASDADDTDDTGASDSEEFVVAYHGEGKKIHLEASSKIRELLSILHKETPDHKVIVFSQFTSMLDIIEPFLRRDGFTFARYDGSMRNDFREASLHQLRTHESTRVLLCSLKCGSLGLNLTAASRVVIVEPFWNPFVEEQAIDRVHRLNQTVDVQIYRLTVDNTVEERILELQEAKRKLAAAAIEGGSKKGVNKLDMNDIMNLFRHDAHLDDKHNDPNADALFANPAVLSQVERGFTHSDVSEVRRNTPPRFDAAREKGKAKRVEHPVWGRR